MKRRTIIITVITIIVIIIGVIIALPKKKSEPPLKLGPVVHGCSKTIPDKQTVSAAIQKQPINAENKITDFTILSITEPATCWDVVTLSSPQKSEQQTVLINRVGNGLYVVAGPSTSFSQSLMEQLAVPTEVQSKLVVFNDNPNPSSQ